MRRAGTRSGVRAPSGCCSARIRRSCATWGWRRPIVLLPRDALSLGAGARPRRARARAGARRPRRLASSAGGRGPARAALVQSAGLAGVSPVCASRASGPVTTRCWPWASTAPTFAAHLVDLARRLRPAGMPWLPAPAMVRQSSLEGRVRAMLDQSIARRPASIRARCLLAAAVVAAALPLAAFGAAAQFFTVRGSLERSNRPRPARRHGRPGQSDDGEPPRSPQRRDGTLRAGRPARPRPIGSRSARSASGRIAKS